MVEQPAFGRRLRQLRRQCGLSQVEVAGSAVSASYISLVESGRRVPSPDIARGIAERLGVPLDQLTSTSAEPATRNGRLELVSQLLAARSARAAGEYEHARDILAAVGEESGGPDEEDARWELSWELATVLALLGEGKERGRLLHELLDASLTADSPHLHARVAAALSEVSRHAGDLAGAVRYAERAINAAMPLDVNSTEWIQARLAIVAGYTESGQWDRAGELEAELLEVVDDVLSSQLRGVTYWLGAAVAVVNDRADDALARLELAERSLRAEIDIRLWIRFQCAAGAIRLACGDHTAAAAALRRARQGTDLIDSSPTVGMLDFLEAAVHEDGSPDPSSVAVSLTSAPSFRSLPPQEQARCELVTARLLAEAGDTVESSEHFGRAAGLYEQAGAYRLATEVWRESAGRGAGLPDHHSFLVPDQLPTG
jgi:transcriptional regulator with XRE-family HTH domain